MGCNDRDEDVVAETRKLTCGHESVYVSPACSHITDLWCPGCMQYRQQQNDETPDGRGYPAAASPVLAQAKRELAEAHALIGGTTNPLPVTLPVEAADRKAIPLVSGVLDYFPAALAAVAALSKKGNDQHNPGQPMHWAREKSTDHADCIGRHLLDRGTIDTDGVRHSAKVAWRALAMLQIELEAQEGAPIPRGAK